MLDNVSSHSPALYQRFAPAEARRILSRIEFHFTPKHASWLNSTREEEIAELPASVPGRQPTKLFAIS